MMTVGKRFATWVLEAAGRRLWGFPPKIVAAVVDQLGAFSASWWLWANVSQYEKTREQMGPLRTHLLVTGISLLNGSSYCTHGHARALGLVYFERSGQLFPLDEDEMLELQGLDGFELRLRFERVLRDAGLAEEVSAFDRMVAIATGVAIGELPQDDEIRHLVEMFAVLGLCGVRADVSPDGAHDPIGGASELVDRYDRAREGRRTSVRVAA